MEAMTTVQKIFYSGEDCEKNCYFFSPSISKRKTVGKKTYYVRRFFTGGKDFEKNHGKACRQTRVTESKNPVSGFAFRRGGVNEKPL